MGKIESRAYNADSPPEDIDAIRARVTLDDGVLVIHELPVLTAFSIDQLFDRANELIAERPEYDMLIDLSEAGRPNAKQRKQLRQRFFELTAQPRRFVLCTGSNFVMSMIAQVVLAHMTRSKISVFKTRAQALESLGRAR